MEAGFGRKQGRQRKAKGSAPGPRWGLDAPDPHQFRVLFGGVQGQSPWSSLPFLASGQRWVP